MPHGDAMPAPLHDSPLPPRVVVITCAVLEDEMAAASKGLSNLLHIEMMPQGLHNDPPRLQRELQAIITRMEAAHPAAEAIALGYGLCSRGTEGVKTTRCRLVMARAHDCITLLLGCRHRYARYVAEHPGTYWYSPGWNRHHTPPGRRRYETLLEQYRRDYGEDNAQFLMESEQHWFTTYSRAAYVDLGAGVTEADLRHTQECARWLGWQYDHQQGDPTLLRDLLRGAWDDDRFIILQPGEAFTMTGDDRIVALGLPPRRNAAP